MERVDQPSGHRPRTKDPLWARVLIAVGLSLVWVSAIGLATIMSYHWLLTLK